MLCRTVSTKLLNRLPLFYSYFTFQYGFIDLMAQKLLGRLLCRLLIQKARVEYVFDYGFACV